MFYSTYLSPAVGNMVYCALAGGSILRPDFHRDSHRSHRRDNTYQIQFPAMFLRATILDILFESFVYPFNPLQFVTVSMQATIGQPVHRSDVFTRAGVEFALRDR